MTTQVDHAPLPVHAATTKSSRAPLLIRMANAVVAKVLRSRAHGLMSKQLLLLEITGQRTGTTYTFPAAYDQLDDLTLVVVAGRPSAKRWWRNLRGEGRSARVLLRGEWRTTSVRLHVGGGDRSATLLRHYFYRFPRAKRDYDLPDKRLYFLDEIRDAARDSVLVELTLTDRPPPDSA